MRIIAIGGGNLLKGETLQIDKYIVKLANKKSPRAILIPTASKDSPSFIKSFKEIYGEKLRCEVDTLNLIRNKYSKKEISNKILSADLIYVGDGNPHLLYRTWKRKGVSKLIRKAGRNGTILSGKSSGAICWAMNGLGSRKLKTYKGFQFIKINFVCHYTKRHKPLILKNLKKLNKPTIALEDGAGIEVKDNKYRVMTSLKNAKAYKLTLKYGKVIEKELPTINKFRDIKELF